MARPPSVLINNFNGGFLTPQLTARIDIDKYGSGCSKAENVIFMPWGGFQNRAGTIFVHKAKYSDKKTFLLNFEYSPDECYVIEAGDKYFRFYYNDGIIMQNDKPFEVITPYLADDLSKLRYVQSADVFYQAHPKYPIHKLLRYGHTNWQLKQLEFKGGPFQDENKEFTTVKASAKTGNITVEASAEIFVSGMEGTLFAIRHPRKDNSISKKFETKEDEISDTLSVKGKWKVETTGAWTGTLKLERSYNEGKTWAFYRSWTSNEDRNIDSEGEELDNNALYRLHMTGFKIETKRFCDTTLSCHDYVVNGIIKISKVIDKKKIEAAVIDPLGDTTAIKEWAFGSFSDYFGYPENITFYSNRLVLSTTKTQPQTIWFSVSGDYDNMTAGDNDDMAFIVPLKNAEVNSINWMLPRKQLMIGSNVEIGLLKEEDSQKALAPKNHKYESQLKTGSSDIDAIGVESVILYCQRQGNAIRELTYNWSEDSYLAPNATMFAPEVLDSPIVIMDKQSCPYSILWIIREDGKLVGYTYERLQNVTAWHYHITEGFFRDLCILKKRDRDDIWAIVDRQNENGTIKCIERFAVRRDDDVRRGIYLDSSLSYEAGKVQDILYDIVLGKETKITIINHGLKDGDRIRIYDAEGCIEAHGLWAVRKIDNDSMVLRDIDNIVDIDSSAWHKYTGKGKLVKVVNTLSGLDHLEGVKVTILADGSIFEDTVKNGAVSFRDYSTIITVGLPYKSTVSPMPLDYATQSGSTIGQIKRISRIKLKVYKTLGGKAGETEESAEPLIFSSTSDIMGLNPPLASKTMFTTIYSVYDYDKVPVIIQDQPYPMTVLCMICELEMYGG